jgi:hypothetical protein
LYPTGIYLGLIAALRAASHDTLHSFGVRVTKYSIATLGILPELTRLRSLHLRVLVKARLLKPDCNFQSLRLPTVRELIWICLTRRYNGIPSGEIAYL